jgi:hypothetical protein
MTARLVHAFAELVGLPGELLALLSSELQSEALMRCALAFKLPSFQLHVFGLYLAGR